MVKASRVSGLLSIMSDSLYDLPTSSNLSYMWNFGSLLGVFFLTQVVSGIFLSFHYICGFDVSFDSLIFIMRDVNGGWYTRSIHANGASFFFFLLYFHMGRGLYYGGYRKIEVWLSGVSLFLLSMMIAFLGYVLPWGQMSFWAATVITNLLSAVPYLGLLLVEWLWGGYSVGGPTLTRFYSFHYVLPFLLLVIIVAHLYFLHETGSSNSLGVSGMGDKVLFSPYYIYKDLLGLFVLLMFYLCVVLNYPYVFMDVDNFVMSNPMVTPVHIQPEWYFLFAYAILRSISSKVGGVLALLSSVLVLYLFPFLMNHKLQSMSFYFWGKFLFWVVIFNWIVLSWVGSCEVIYPYSLLSLMVSFNYFLFFFFFKDYDWFWGLFGLVVLAMGGVLKALIKIILQVSVSLSSTMAL